MRYSSCFEELSRRLCILILISWLKKIFWNRSYFISFFQKVDCDTPLICIVSRSYLKCIVIWNLSNRSNKYKNTNTNTYQTSADLIIDTNEGRLECNKSDEGATQGDVATMQMYGMSIRPLIDELSRKTVSHHSKQAWYADDASCTGTIEELLKWWNLLCEQGPKYGYYPNSTKTVLILKHKNLLTKTKQLFGSTLNRY